jgi:hypothetical protein
MMQSNGRLDILRIWREAVGELIVKARPLARALALPACGMVALEIVRLSVDGMPFLLLEIPYAILFAVLAVSTHRIILLGRRSAPKSWGSSLDRNVATYLGYSIIIGCGVFFLAMILALIVGLSLAPYSPDPPLLAFVIGAAFICLPGLYLSTRFSMILPAKAIGESLAWSDVVDASGRNGWRLVAAVWLPLFATALAIAPLDWLVGNLAVEVDAPITSLLSPVFGVIGVAAVSCAFRELRRLPHSPIGRSPPSRANPD